MSLKHNICIISAGKWKNKPKQMSLNDNRGFWTNHSDTTSTWMNGFYKHFGSIISAAKWRNKQRQMSLSDNRSFWTKSSLHRKCTGFDPHFGNQLS